MDLFEKTAKANNSQVFVWDVIFQIVSNYYILQK